ncbi:MAG: precorrin-2 C(20)-methyltransferase [Ktedonobacteraceae bacterium]
MKPDQSRQHQGPGKLYGVGAGPGAPDLLTIRARRILQTCPVICLPAAHGASYVGRIIEDLLDLSWQEVLTVRFPMQRERELAQPARENAARAVLERLRAGLDVAFVTEGDPLVYSTFGYLLEIVRRQAPEIAIEVVPGVSSITAAAAAARLPLSSWDERVAIIPAAYAAGQAGAAGAADLRTLLQLFDTVVLLKVSPVFDVLLNILEELDLLRHATFVRRCSTEEEEVLFDLASLRGQSIDYFSLIIVRNPHAISNT